MMQIRAGGLDQPQVIALLHHHVASSRAQTADGSAHALDLTGLSAADIRFWSAWEAEMLMGVGALRLLSADHGEVKSMHVAEIARRRGVGMAMLAHIAGEARSLGIGRLSLETGSWDYFRPAHALYRRFGFVECAPFGPYRADPNSLFMTIELRA